MSHFSHFALSAAEQGKIVTFGIQPTRPETRYGYIQTAQRLFTSNHYWNSGIFLFKAQALLREVDKFQPLLLVECKKALSIAKQDLDFLRLDSKSISPHFNLSIDYAVMEHTTNAVVAPTEMDWSDVGSWDVLWEIAPKTEDGNVLIGDIFTHQVRNSYIRSQNHLVSIVGLDRIRKFNCRCHRGCRFHYASR